MNYGDPCLSNHATNVVENHGAKNLVSFVGEFVLS